MTSAQRVRIVGAGLLGTSIGLALRLAGYEVTLVDPSPVSAALAADLGAGRVAAPGDPAPDVVVVAAPPDVVGDLVVQELETWPDATVTDVASVKQGVQDVVRRRAGLQARRYVPGHPMAGRERSGAVAARSDLFVGRTWVLCPEGAEQTRVETVRDLAAATGARVVAMTVAEHDRAVAAVSHVPQVAASVVAAQLTNLPETAVDLSGQGVRDVTRIAASDPLLWTQILSGNAAAVRPLLDGVIASLTAVRDALVEIDVVEQTEASPHTASGHAAPRAVLARVIAAGQEGRARIPGKHGTPPTSYATVVVVIPDEPGALGRLFTLVGEVGISIEDMRLEHDDGVAAGLLELDVLPVRAQALHAALAGDGWSAHVLETN